MSESVAMREVYMLYVMWVALRSVIHKRSYVGRFLCNTISYCKCATIISVQ